MQKNIACLLYSINTPILKINLEEGLRKLKTVMTVQYTLNKTNTSGYGQEKGLRTPPSNYDIVFIIYYEFLLGS